MSGKRYEFTGKAFDIPFIHKIGYQAYNHAVPLDFHQHMSGVEITIVLKGSADWLVGDGRRYRQPGNTLFIMPEKLNHKGSGNVIFPCHLCWLILDFNAADLVFSDKMLQSLRGRLKEQALQSLLLTPGLRKILEQTVATIKRKRLSPLYHKELQIEFYAIILEIMEQLRQPASPRFSVLRRAEEYIEHNLRKNISVAELAGACQLSESHFFIRFKEESGLTPLDFVLRKKLGAVEQRLRESSRSITEIAFEFGFSSSQYFAVIFKRYFGCSPGQWRKQKGRRSLFIQ